MEAEGRAPSDRAELVAGLFDVHYSSLCGLAFVILGDRGKAEEATQEAFVRLYASWRRIEAIEHPAAYLRMIVLNLCRTKIRRARVEERANELLHRVSRAPQGEPETHIDLWNCVRSLPERQRLCIVLRYLEDLPEREIAELLGCSVGTVKSQLSRARGKLADALGLDALEGDPR